MFLYIYIRMYTDVWLPERGAASRAAATSREVRMFTYRVEDVL